MPSLAVWTSELVNAEHFCNNYFNITIPNLWFLILILFLHQIQTIDNLQVRQYMSLRWMCYSLMLPGQIRNAVIS